jgi:fucose 4-O-acetylase-like acetyltransferase
MQYVSNNVSVRFRFWVFISMLLIVFIHAYNLKARYLQPWTTPGETMTLTSFTEYFFANGILRFLVPLLFIISGYLYALHDEISYGQRIKKRFRVLLIPYLIWSAAGMAFVYVLEIFPQTKSLVIDSHLVQISNTRLLLHDYHWYELLARWIIVPVPYQLWFVRVLIIYNLAYPVLFWCVTNKIVKWIFFPAVTFLWVATFGTLIVEGEGLLFFSLGIWMQKKHFNMESPSTFLKPIPWAIAFILLCTIKTWLAFKGFAVLGNYIFPILAIMHKLIIICGLIAAWYGSSYFVLRFVRKKWFVSLSAFSFIIYAVHAPAVALFINGMFALLHHCTGYRIITYILLPVMIIFISIAFGALLCRFAPRMYAITTGGRGF